MPVSLHFLQPATLTQAEIVCAKACAQIDRFSSSAQNRLFWPFLPAMECLKMSTIDGGHYQLRFQHDRAETPDGYIPSAGSRVRVWSEIRTRCGHAFG